MAHLMISAAHKSSGKTSVSAGIAAALTRRGLKVQPFKKGLYDGVDPAGSNHNAATGTSTEESRSSE